MFHLQPQTHADVMSLQRQELLQKLQPDEITVQDVLNDATLIAGVHLWGNGCGSAPVRAPINVHKHIQKHTIHTGFDDPQIMKAVAEIAQDPSVCI